MQGITLAKENGFTLIISLDCGIRSKDLIGHAKHLGMDFIVCDHHLPDDQLPPAVAILDPKQPGCPYPYKELCGCGVGFKLITALAERLGLPKEEPYQYLDLLATAIAADIVPLDGENRVLAYYGLNKINQDPASGIKAMIQLGGLVNPLRMNTLVFMIAPRINAAGRMDDAANVVQLFTTPDHAKAMAFAGLLHTVNTERKTADLNITVEALALLEKDASQAEKKSIVLYQEHWHKGVIGIVASRLTEKFSRPAVVLTRNGDFVSGSARSFNGFNLYEAIHACREHLVGYGGHPAAAGFTLLPDQVEAFSNKFEEIVAATIEPQSLVPELTIDAEITFADIQPAFFQALDEMEPFGPGNPQPVFIARRVFDTGYCKMVKDLHIRFSLCQGNITLQGIGYNLAGKFGLLGSGYPIDIVFTLEENEWNGRKTLQLKIIDFELS
jgi:single-stranded-DNA-specific exonuclease